MESLKKEREGAISGLNQREPYVGLPKNADTGSIGI